MPASDASGTRPDRRAAFLAAPPAQKIERCLHRWSFAPATISGPGIVNSDPGPRDRWRRGRAVARLAEVELTAGGALLAVRIAAFLALGAEIGRIIFH